MVSCLKSLSHFDFSFMYGVMVCSNFIDLHAAVQRSQHHLLKRVSFSHFIFLALSVLVYFWAFCSVPLIHVSLSVPIPCGFDYCNFVVLSEV